MSSKQMKPSDRDEISEQVPMAPPVPTVDPDEVPEWSSRRWSNLLPTLQPYMTLIVVVIVVGIVVISQRLSNEVQAKLPDVEKLRTAAEEARTGLGKLLDDRSELDQKIGALEKEKQDLDKKLQEALDAKQKSDDEVKRLKTNEPADHAEPNDAEMRKERIENLNAANQTLQAKVDAFEQLMGKLPNEQQFNAIVKFSEDIKPKGEKPSPLSERLSVELSKGLETYLKGQVTDEKFLDYAILAPLNAALEKSQLKSQVDGMTNLLQQLNAERNSLWKENQARKITQTGLVLWDDNEIKSACYEPALRAFLTDSANAPLLLSPGLDLRVWTGSVGTILNEKVYPNGERFVQNPESIIIPSFPESQMGQPGAVAPEDVAELFSGREGLGTLYEAHCILVIPVRAGVPQDQAKFDGWKGIRVDAIVVAPPGANKVLENWQQWEQFCQKHRGTASLVMATPQGDTPPGKQLKALDQRSTDAVRLRLQQLIHP